MYVQYLGGKDNFEPAVYERVWPRSREEILSFLDGFELLEPGLVRPAVALREARTGPVRINIV